MGGWREQVEVAAAAAGAGGVKEGGEELTLRDRLEFLLPATTGGVGDGGR